MTNYVYNTDVGSVNQYFLNYLLRVATGLADRINGVMCTYNDTGTASPEGAVSGAVDVAGFSYAVVSIDNNDLTIETVLPLDVEGDITELCLIAGSVSESGENVCTITLDTALYKETGYGAKVTIVIAGAVE